MMKLLRNLDRRLEPFVNEVDRTLKTPVSRALTFDVFRDDDAPAADQPVAAEAEMTARRAVETLAHVSGANAATRDVNWDCCPAQKAQA